jgi:lipopolysaccharide export LptBFGC system permease protein LptF
MPRGKDNRKGFHMTSTTIRFGFIVAVSLIAAAEPALAGITPTPGPMIGAGLPALALFGAGYWLIRRRRRS